MTTITTVGYGDISGHTVFERIICIFLHLIGVLSYSFASGSLTSIIQNYDQINDANREKLAILDRLFKENDFPSDLYYQLKTSIVNQEDTKEKSEYIDFLQDLPYRL